MKRSLSVIALSILLVTLFSSVATALPVEFHPPVSRLDLPTEAATGLHTASHNLPKDSIASHVFFFMLSPH
ncbi:MAG: hypothetical protein R6U92_07430 [Bacillota bacterium]